MRSIRWASVATVGGCALVLLICAIAALRGRPWAWAPGLVAAAVGLRELRALQRGLR
ncbi:hypothetical protein QUV83_16710 [Cellulomonas cellasea]|uniref:hypothetical protein n=1 Tax=Cellulomonas cellasea TaxID=43670 RepID=UPI0025A34018|nr:hypothetical protein [Cellulomonas cellasea]MDM8086415.1 hypothetical protein [Cellulomonas cellasea]